MSRIVATLLCGAAAVLGVTAAAGQSGAAPAPSGKDLYRANCGGCHLEGGFGTRVLSRRVPEGQAPLEARKGLARRYVQTVVRNGLGSMPQIRRTELGDADLAAIAVYLETGQ